MARHTHSCRNRRARAHLPAWCLAPLLLTQPLAVPAADVTLIVRGLPGAPDYDGRFENQEREVSTAASEVAGGSGTVKVLNGIEATRDAVVGALREAGAALTPADEFVLMLIGHGSFDGLDYKFNIPGPDFTGEELKTWLDELPTQRQLVVAMTSSSGALLDVLASEERVLITATKSGTEQNAPLFGNFWSEGLSSDQADTDKNEIITAQELFDYATARVAAHYDIEGLLATEHARAVGGNPDNFNIARVGQLRGATLDPEVERMLADRTSIEADIQALREQRAGMDEDAYYEQLEALMLDLGRLQRQIDERLDSAR